MTSAGLGPYGPLLLIIIACLVLGMFMDGLAMLVVTVPIFLPIITGLGFDPLWFGVVAVILIGMGMITPPVGLNVLVVKSVAQDVPMAVCLLAVIVFPQIALTIPSAMFR